MKKNNATSSDINIKRLYLGMSLTLLGLFALISFGWTLFYHLCNSDIVLYQSILPEVLEIFIDLTETLAYAIAFSVLVFVIFHRYSGISVTSFMLIYIGATAARRILDLIVTLILQKSLLLFDDIIMNALLVILDIFLVIVVCFLAKARSARYYRERAIKTKAKSLFKDDLPTKINSLDLFPFKKFYHKGNPIQSSMLLVAIFITAIRIVSRLIFDIGYGAPEDFWEVLIMILHYASDVVIGIIFYTLSIPIFGRLFSCGAKSKKKENSEEVK